MIDSHAHLTSPELMQEADALVKRALEAGVKRIVNICTDAPSLEAGVALQQAFPEIVYLTAATTPHDVEREGESFFPLVERAARAGQLSALGETGLDFFYSHSPKEIQLRFLERYFHLALDTGLPLVFHCRDAFTELFASADVSYRSERALLHCFTGTLEEAKGVLDRGWMLALSGIVTFKKSEALREVARYVPLDRLLVETDAPYLAPQSRRGQRNEPSFLPETARCLAEVKRVSLEMLAEATAENARQFFAIN